MDPAPAGLFRISLGVLITVFYLCLGPNWTRYYAHDGVMSQALPASFGIPDNWASLFSWTEPIVPITVFWWVGLAAALLFTVGLWTRVATVVLFLLQGALVQRANVVVNGEDLVFRMLLFYGCFAPLGAAFSLDARRIGAPRPARWWAVRLMQINVVLIYVVALPNRFADDAAWWRGEAIYYALASDMWGRFPWPLLFAQAGGFLSNVFTYGTALAEGLFPFTVWFRTPRLINVAALALLHVGIAILMTNVTFFTLSMVCAFWLFIPADLVRRWVTALQRRRSIPAAVAHHSVPGVVR
jgi:hypothetical protein